MAFLGSDIHGQKHNQKCPQLVENDPQKDLHLQCQSSGLASVLTRLITKNVPIIWAVFCLKAATAEEKHFR